MENGESGGPSSFTYDRDFHEIVTDKPVLRRTLEKFLNNMIDEITLGLIFDEHRKAKINGFNLNCDDAPITPEQHDLILQQNSKRTTAFINCPNCEKLVGSLKFAPHLEKCMGMVPRGRLRKSTRRSASNSSSKERESPAPYTSLTSDDDDDDAEWKPGKKGSGGRRRERSRSKKRRGGGSRKGSDSGESVDVDGDDDSESTVSSISDFRGEYTNGLSSSPTSSMGSSDTEKRKRDSSRSKKNSKNRSYPNSLSDGD